MTSFFTILNQSLALEKVETTNIPDQFYATSYEEFYQQFSSYLQSKNLKSILILTDGVHKNIATENQEDISNIFQTNLENFEIDFVNLSEISGINPKELHASEYYLDQCKKIIAEKKDYNAYLSLGSGTITDLLKHALFLLKNQHCYFISIPTATTVTAFTSAFSVVDIGGAKKTRPSRTIQSTFWIEPLLKAAPMPLLKAGFGDLLARFVATADWYLGQTLKMCDDYTEIALRLMAPYNSFLKAQTAQGPVYLLEEMPRFAETLAMAGISMSLCNQTTPLSGYEHTISHGLDFLRLTSQHDLVLHGEQVALACLTSAMSYEWLLQQDNFEEKKFRTLNEVESKKLIEKLIKNAPFSDEKEKDLSQLSDLFYKDYLEKSAKWDKIKTQFHEFSQQWPEIKNKLKDIVIEPKEMENILNRIQLPDIPEKTNPPTSALELRWAVRFAPFIRSRFCLADFLFWTGEDPCAIAAL